MPAAGQETARARPLNHLGHRRPGEPRNQRALGPGAQLQALAVSNRIEGLQPAPGDSLPISSRHRGGQARDLDRVGLGHLRRSRFGGGRLNERPPREIIRLMEIDGEVPVLQGLPDPRRHHPQHHRRPTATSPWRRGPDLEAQAIAMAAKLGGIVIAQVEHRRNSVRSTPPGERSRACWSIAWWWRKGPVPHADLQRAIQRRLCGRDQVPMSAVAGMAMKQRSSPAGRAMELRSDAVVNLGIPACPKGGNVAAEEQVIDLLTLTTGPGVIGNIPASGLSFSAAINAEGDHRPASQFDFYDSGGLDIAFEDGAGRPPGQSQRLPASGRAAGAGGSSTSRQNAKGGLRGHLTAGGCGWRRGQQAAHPAGQQGQKFVEVGNAPSADRRPRSSKKTVLYVTERCCLPAVRRGAWNWSRSRPGSICTRTSLGQMDFVPVMKQPRF